MKSAAKFISIIFHPVLIPTLGIFILFNTNSYLNFAISKEMKTAILLLIGISTFIIPTLISFLLLNKKVITSLEMETQKERIIPYSFTIIVYFFTLYMLNKAPIPPLISKFILATTISIILAFIINFKSKISAHMIGIGGLLGALITVAILLHVYMLPIIICVFIIAGLLGSSRLILNAHTSSQVYAGFALGFICQFAVIYF
jgi:hypothetical protein